ncbi:epidermal patterning factor-like protein 3 [Nicotiana attenuata]|uniref:Epidermal patterning factor-like protein n=1 Tax=Nicotiana attenuata TaxID=49451 RepID=A0A314L941_NICAT|nr:epidermal patterning factor-like protein 3 [Nicotiana attenuata]
MKIRNYVFLLAAILHILSSVTATRNKPFATYKSPHHQQGKDFNSAQAALQKMQGLDNMERAGDKNENAIETLRRLGSRPPNCEHRCGRCKPCIAIQVPTKADHLEVQYANYEPEGWKCKCGTSLFDP